MANPKRRHSKARTHTRRSTWKAAVPAITRCPQCREPRLAHTVCPKCGHYRGRAVISQAAEN